jgi:hypothetical protein
VLVQDAVHRSDKLVDLEWFSEDPRRTKEPTDFATVRTTAHDDDRNIAGVGPSFAPSRDELRTIEIRETKVEYDRRRLSRESSTQRLSAIDGRQGIQTRGS